MLYLNRATGNVRCDLPGLATLAQEELDRCLEARTGSDITKIIQRLFEREADLFPIREQGGAYFCPQMHVSFINKIQTFIGRINGRLNRYPVPAGTPQGDKSVKESVTAGIEALIAEHNTAIDSFGEDTRPSTLERAAERIQQTRHKVECYAVYLAEQKSRLEKDLEKATTRLRTCVDQLA